MWFAGFLAFNAVLRKNAQARKKSSDKPPFFCYHFVTVETLRSKAFFGPSRLNVSTFWGKRYVSCFSDLPKLAVLIETKETETWQQLDQ